MRRHAIAAALLLAALVPSVPPGPAFGECTAREKLDLRREGASRAEIEDICGDEGDAPARQAPSRRRSESDEPSAKPNQSRRLALVCSTPWGVCSMTLPLAVGNSCTCNLKNGTVPGVAR